ncbi:hypothetical protein ACFW9I_02835 [[Kitasatospora] papulosa]|uniref:hypothetical protein n=1 Tax=[Kitasatospora] papulosa TaxID=1464011 RepID=UPI0036CCA3D5
MTAPDEPTVHGVQIDAQPGEATIRLNGQLLPAGQLTGYILQHDVHAALPTLVLHTRQPDSVHWEGLARVAVADSEQDPGQAIAAYLANIDPAALHRAALNRDDLDGTPHELTRAMLQQLVDWAQGRT